MKTINIEQLPTLDNILTGELIDDFRKTVIDVMKCINGSYSDNIMRKLVFTLSILEDIREEYSDVMEKE
ncbi:MAG: hypothetical protein IIV21_03855 [Bacteroidales bacterium]|nr:hypothetical protein [Bacteroidales bacterium]